MAPDHKAGRILLMKLYKKEMQCVPGSPEHFEVMQMIDGCRKNIGLEEGVFDKIKADFKRRKKLFGKGITEQEISQAELDKIAGDAGTFF